MAVEFKKLSAEWATCKAKLATCWLELDSAAQTDKNTKDLLEGAREDIVEKVFAAKKAGTVGTELADFMSVKEVKKAWTDIEATLKVLKDAHDRYEDGVKAFSPLYDQAVRIAKTCDDEVTERKKQKILQSKSIPDLEKLSKEINADITVVGKKNMRSVKDLAKQKPAKFTFDKSLEDRINKDIKSGVNAIKVDADDSTLTREFAVRSLAVAASKMNDRATAATALCVEALTAFKSNDAATAKTALGKAIKIADEAQDIAEHYGKTLKSKGEEIKSHKDGKEMLTRVTKINTTVNTILTTVAKTQKAIG